jgi:hypothetical protein
MGTPSIVIYFNVAGMNPVSIGFSDVNERNSAFRDLSHYVGKVGNWVLSGSDSDTGVTVNCLNIVHMSTSMAG